MNEIIYVTGSEMKFTYVKNILKDVPIALRQESVAIDEIQSADSEKISRKKATDAFAILKKPLFVTDTFWSIPALNGFPGAYMKEVNQWLTSTDFLNLMRDKSDRTIVARDIITYTDGRSPTLFVIDLQGIIATEPYPTGPNNIDSIVQFDGKYLTEYKENNLVVPSEKDSWNGFKNFLKGNNS